MTKKRRVILIVVVLAVVGAVGGGIFVYVRRTSGAAILKRAKLALEAGDFEKARKQAEDYITKEPGDYEGYYFLARALGGQGKHDEARSALQKAIQCKPDKVSLVFAMADTYSRAAYNAISGKDAKEDIGRIDQALRQLTEVEKCLGDYLETVKPTDEKSVVDIRERLGRNTMRMAELHQDRARRFEKEAQRAKATPGREQDAEAKTELGRQAGATAVKEFDRAIAILLGVIQKDPRRDKTGVELLEMCRQRGNDKARDLARKAIMALDSPPPNAAMLLTQEELQGFERYKDVATRRNKLVATGKVLDNLIRQNPGHVGLKATRLDVALALDDAVLAQRLCDEILKAEPDNLAGGLGQAQLLAEQGRLRDSEQRLRTLAEKYRTVAPVHYAHANVSLALGNQMAALRSMQRVRELDPRHGPAWTYLARVALQKGLMPQAYQDAQTAYKVSGNDPAAVRVYVQAAVGTDRDTTAREALEKIKAAKDVGAEMLMVGADGYALLGERDESNALARRAVRTEALAFRDRVARVRAFVQVGRVGEAEKLLSAEVAARPRDGRTRFVFGQLYRRTGRLLAAIEQYQRAVDLEPSEAPYRISLARALLDYGDVQRCRVVLDRLDPENPAGQVLRREAQLIEGGGGDAQDMLQPVREGEGPGLAKAVELLGTGQPEECAKACRDALRKQPTSVPLRTLLGHAYLQLGRAGDCIAEWIQVLKYSPDRFGTYLALAKVMSSGMKLEDVVVALGKNVTARKDLIVLAGARLLAQRGEYGRAAMVLKPGIAHPTTTPEAASRMKMLRVQYLARAGDVRQALTEVEPLTGDKLYRKPATLEKAMLLAAAGRAGEADAVLTGLRGLAGRDGDGAMLRGVAELYMLMCQTDQAARRRAAPGSTATSTGPASTRPAGPWLARAEAVCKQHEALLPNDPGSHLLWARWWSLAGQSDNMVASYRKAIACQPGHVHTYIVLVGLLDAMEQPDEVRKVLTQLEAQSKAARTAAMWARGKAFVHWGLHKRAAHDLRELSASGYGDNPRLRLRLAQSLANLGEKAEARELLKKIPRYAEQYVPAQLLLAEMTVVNEQKLELVQELAKFKPRDPLVMAMKMRILLAMDRPADAAATFRAFLEQTKGSKRLPTVGPGLALRALTQTGESSSAAGLSLAMYRVSGLKRWAQIGILLMPPQHRDQARSMLSKVSEADETLSLLGLCLAVEAGETASAKAWADQANKPPPSRGGQPPLAWQYSQYRLLTRLAVSAEAPDKKLVEQLPRFSRIREEAVAELAAQPPGAKRTAEVVKLLRASLAMDFGLTELARQGSMAILKARPTCQWAANVALKTGGDAKVLAEVHKLVEPKDGRLARWIEADILAMKKQPAEAAKMYHTAAHTGPQDTLLMLREGEMTVAAGRLPEALTLYRLVWGRARTARVANALAYLTARLHPTDAAKLAEAAQWADYAVRRQPGVAHYWDTRGWVAHLRGDSKRALRDLRRAVKALPDSLTVHYHLGKVEAQAGSKYFAKEHLNAVVDISRKLKTEAKTLTSDEAEALRLAQAEMKKLLPPGSG